LECQHAMCFSMSIRFNFGADLKRILRLLILNKQQWEPGNCRAYAAIDLASVIAVIDKILGLAGIKVVWWVVTEVEEIAGVGSTMMMMSGALGARCVGVLRLQPLNSFVLSPDNHHWAWAAHRNYGDGLQPSFIKERMNIQAVSRNLFAMFLDAIRFMDDTRANTLRATSGGYQILRLRFCGRAGRFSTVEYKTLTSLF